MPDEPRLTPAQRRALMALTGEWSDVPSDGESVEMLRRFDVNDIEIKSITGGYSWRLTPAGIALKAKLEAENG